MRRRALDLVAFDGDDTLWHNERSYRNGRERFRRLLSRAGVTLTESEIDAHVNRTELNNLDVYGYGVSSFVLSLIETAVELTGDRLGGGELRELIDLAKRMLTEDIELFAGVPEVVAEMAASYPLMLITKGDLLHQTSKLERSGLRGLFRFVEVVSHKTAADYAAILARHGIDPARFLMVGNSIKSDVLPVVDAGGWAVHIPAALSWAHEHADAPAAAKRRYFEVATLAELGAVVAALERRLLRTRTSRPPAPGVDRRRPAAGTRRS